MFETLREVDAILGLKKDTIADALKRETSGSSDARTTKSKIKIRALSVHVPEKDEEEEDEGGETDDSAFSQDPASQKKTDEPRGNPAMSTRGRGRGSAAKREPDDLPASGGKHEPSKIAKGRGGGLGRGRGVASKGIPSEDNRNDDHEDRHKEDPKKAPKAEKPDEDTVRDLAASYRKSLEKIGGKEITDDKKGGMGIPPDEERAGADAFEKLASKAIPVGKDANLHGIFEGLPFFLNPPTSFF